MAVIKHPRRFGFAIFNIAAIALFALSWAVQANGIDDGVAGLTNVLLGTMSMILVAVVVAGSWIAWGSMVWLRRRRMMGHRHSAA